MLRRLDNHSHEALHLFTVLSWCLRLIWANKSSTFSAKKASPAWLQQQEWLTRSDPLGLLLFFLGQLLLIAKANSLQLMVALAMKVVQFMLGCSVESTNGWFLLYEVRPQLIRVIRLPLPAFIPILRFIYRSLQLASPLQALISAIVE